VVKLVQVKYKGTAGEDNKIATYTTHTCGTVDTDGKLVCLGIMAGIGI